MRLSGGENKFLCQAFPPPPSICCNISFSFRVFCTGSEFKCGGNPSAFTVRKVRQVPDLVLLVTPVSEITRGTNLQSLN